MKKTLGQRIRELRDERDLSLRELARQVDISAPFLSDIELGRRFPSDEILELLARALGVPAADLEQFDHRPIVEEVKARATEDPAYGYMLRKVLEEFRTSEELRKLLDKK